MRLFGKPHLVLFVVACARCMQLVVGPNGFNHSVWHAESVGNPFKQPHYSRNTVRIFEKLLKCVAVINLWACKASQISLKPTLQLGLVVQNGCCELGMVVGDAGRAQGVHNHTYVSQEVDYVIMFSHDRGQQRARINNLGPGGRLRQC